MNKGAIKVAILDLYNNEPNQGMRCILDLVSNCRERFPEKTISYDVFETRFQAQAPGLEYDIFISTGGPGDPFDGEGSEWEALYFNLLDRIWNHNQKNNAPPKFVFFICHSFAMMCRFFKLATIRKRDRSSFGILPVCKTASAQKDFLFKPLPDIYYAADFRKYEAVEPQLKNLNELNAKILSREQMRKDPTLELALMAIRISDEIIGTQYHPEADPVSMLYHFKQPERKKQVLSEFGEEKYLEMITHLEDPENILMTRKTILPAFLVNAINRLDTAQ